MSRLTDSAGNGFFSFQEVVTYGVDLAVGWGVTRIPYRQKAVFSNWTVEQGKAIGQPGVITFMRQGPNDPRIELRSCTFRNNAPQDLVRWVVEEINTASAKR
jgi:hypothetical protein